MMKGLILYIGVGQGFKSPAIAIYKEFQSKSVEVEIFDIFDHLGFKNIDIILKSGWKFVLKFPLLFTLILRILDTKLIKSATKLLSNIINEKIINFIKLKNPDFILSTHPVITDVLSFLSIDGRIRIYGYNSDIVLAHQSYINNRVHKYFVPSKEGYKNMIKKGQKKNRIIQCSFPLDKKYFKKFSTRRNERRKLGIKDKFTLLFVFGSDAIGIPQNRIIEILKEKDHIQVIAVCGKNKKLIQELKLVKKNNKIKDFYVKGFVKNMQDYLYCSDVVAGKSGWSFVFECIYMKKPFIVMKAMSNEKPAADLLINNKIGWWPRSESEFINIIDNLPSNIMLEEANKRFNKLDYKFGAEDIVKKVIRDVKD